MFEGELGTRKFEQPAVTSYVSEIFVETERPTVRVFLLAVTGELA